MSDHLEFPRVIYRGDPDTLGTGHDVKGLVLNSETKRCESADDWEDAKKAGWRLTREDGKPVKKNTAGEIQIPAQTVVTNPHDNPSGQARANETRQAETDAQASAQQVADGNAAAAAAAPKRNAVGRAKKK